MLLPKPSPDSPPMFESRFFDRFSRTPWFMVPAVFVPGVIWCFYEAVVAGVSVPAAAGLFAVGWLSWTLAEYWLHRTFFHWEPPGRFGHMMHFVVHGVHHKWPRDRYRLVMPTAVSVSLFFAFLGVFRLLLGDTAWGYLAGFAFGYMFYDLTHYYIHHANPRSGALKKLRRHHLIHHSPNKGSSIKFGVSTTLWDHVFRSY